MKLKILLIDDEELTTLALSKMLGQFPDQYEVTGTARNGALALSLLETTPADVVIVDIRMPVMDGIEFLSQLNKRGLSPYSIVLSAYRDFEYAQQALHYGASDYLLKPISREKLLEALKTANERIEEQHSLTEESEKSLLQKRRRALHAYLEKGTQTAHFNPQWKDRITGPYRILHMSCPEEIPQEFTEDCYNAGWIPCSTSSMIYQIAQTMTSADIAALTQKALEDSREYFLPYLSFTLSSVKNTFNELPEAYRECMHAQEYYFYLSEPPYISYTDIKAIRHVTLKELEPHFDKLSEYLLLSAEEQTSEQLNFIYDLLSHGKNAQPAVVHQLFYDFLRMMMDTLQKNNSDSGITDYVKKITLQKMQSLHTLEVLYRYVSDQLDFYFNHIETQYLQSNDRIVARVKEFCAANYSTDLSLDDIAASVFISKNYLAQVFKEKTGTSLWNYFTDLRMEKAKELLSDGSVTASKAAEMVGYKNASHFGRVFKERTGLTPKDYSSRRNTSV